MSVPPDPRKLRSRGLKKKPRWSAVRRGVSRIGDAQHKNGAPYGAPSPFAREGAELNMPRGESAARENENGCLKSNQKTKNPLSLARERASDPRARQYIRGRSRFGSAARYRAASVRA